MAGRWLTVAVARPRRRHSVVATPRRRWLPAVFASKRTRWLVVTGSRPSVVAEAGKPLKVCQGERCGRTACVPATLISKRNRSQSKIRPTRGVKPRAVGAYIIGKLRLDWNYYGDAITAVCSSIMGILMMSCYFYDHLCFIYLSYILYGIVSQMVFVSNCSEIAKRLKNNCYSLVYGFNLLGSLLISTFMTIFLVQINFLDITIPGRFLFIGGLDVCLGVGFFFLIVSQIDRVSMMNNTTVF
uniref:Uncharacterized protein n=1 Tax=Schizaphis graminum TaxID=13262 RepID=A0A2S2NGZ6_SCHGA